MDAMIEEHDVLHMLGGSPGWSMEVTVLGSVSHMETCREMIAGFTPAWPPVRARLFRVDGARVLMVTLNFIFIDGLSELLRASDVMHGCRGEAPDRPALTYAQ